jgi:predicted RNA-binding Zn-ribbon protein involved in translation (DUF1610 family)
MRSPVSLREETVSDGAEKKRREKIGSKCPQCGKKRVFRSHRKNILEKFRSQFGRYPFRCHACGYRFFRELRSHGGDD